MKNKVIVTVAALVGLLLALGLIGLSSSSEFGVYEGLVSEIQSFIGGLYPVNVIPDDELTIVPFEITPEDNLGAVY